MASKEKKKRQERGKNTKAGTQSSRELKVKRRKQGKKFSTRQAIPLQKRRTKSTY